MPNNNSWNGRWTGQLNLYAVVRAIQPKAYEKELNGKNFYYDFGDGWGANVNCKIIDSKLAAKVRRKSKGFYGYNWMINEIVAHGRILTLLERKEMESDE